MSMRDSMRRIDDFLTESVEETYLEGNMINSVKSKFSNMSTGFKNKKAASKSGASVKNKMNRIATLIKKLDDIVTYCNKAVETETDKALVKEFSNVAKKVKDLEPSLNKLHSKWANISVTERTIVTDAYNDLELMYLEAMNAYLEGKEDEGEESVDAMQAALSALNDAKGSLSKDDKKKVSRIISQLEDIASGGSSSDDDKDDDDDVDDESDSGDTGVDDSEDSEGDSKKSTKKNKKSSKRKSKSSKKDDESEDSEGEDQSDDNGGDEDDETVTESWMDDFGFDDRYFY